MGRVVRIPCYRTGTDEEPEDKWKSYEREKHYLFGICQYLPALKCTKVNNAMQQLTSFTYQMSEQHKDGSNARQTRGTADSEKLMAFIGRRYPFDADPSLRNI